MEIKGFNEEQAKSLQSVVDTLNDTQKAKFEELAEKSKGVEDLQASVKKYGDELSEVAEQLKAIKAKAEPSDNKEKTLNEAMREKLLSEVVAKKDDVKFGIKFEVNEYSQKAFIASSTNSVAAGSLIPQPVFIQGIDKPVRRNFSLYNLVQQVPLSNRTYSQVNKVSTTNGPEFRNEGDATTEIEYKYKTVERTCKNIMGFTKAAEESLSDIDWLQSEINTELNQDMLQQLDTKMWSGNETTNAKEFDGFKVIAPVFDKGGVNPMADPDIYAVMRACVAQVARANFVADYIVVHSDVLANMDLAKGSNGQYVMPPFKSANGTVIAGATVIANNGLDTDDILVGEFSQAKLRVRKGYAMEIGKDGNDFSKNLVSMKSNMRMDLDVPEHKKPAFVQGSIAAITTALTTAG